MNEKMKIEWLARTGCRPNMPIQERELPFQPNEHPQRVVVSVTSDDVDVVGVPATPTLVISPTYPQEVS